MILQRKCFGLWGKVKDTFDNAITSKGPIKETIKSFEGLNSEYRDLNSNYEKTMKEVDGFMGSKRDKRKTRKVLREAIDSNNRMIEDNNKIIESRNNELDAISKSRRNLAIAGAVGLGAAGLGYGIYKWRKNKKKKREEEEKNTRPKQFSATDGKVVATGSVNGPQSRFGDISPLMSMAVGSSIGRRPKVVDITKKKKAFSGDDHAALKSLAVLGGLGGAVYGLHKLGKYMDKKQLEKDRKELEEYRADQKRRGLSKAEIEQEDRDRAELLSKRLARQYRR